MGDDVVCFRAVFLDGLERRVPTRHSVFFSFMFGPLGLLSHFITQMIVGRIGKSADHNN